MFEGNSSKIIILMIFLTSFIGFLSASTTIGETVIFVSDADDDESYPHAGEFANVQGGQTNYNDEYDDSMAIMDYTDDGLNVAMYDDAGDFGTWYDIENQCGILFFDHDSTSSEDGVVRYYEGAMVEYDGVIPSSGDPNYDSKDFDDGNIGGENTAEDLYNSMKNTGFDGQSVSGNTGNMELIRGSNDWRLKGDLLCGDHDNNGVMEWKMCTTNTDQSTVDINGKTYGCDGTNRDWSETGSLNAQFTIEDNNGDGEYSVGEELTFSSSSDADKYHWDWDNDGNYEETLDFSSETTHSFDTGGSHTIELQVEDQYGQTATTSQTITLNSDCLYGSEVNEYGDMTNVYWNYGYSESDLDFEIAHNDASCPDPSQMSFNVCDHSIGEEFITKEDDQYKISFDVPQDVPCTWKRYNATGEYSGHRVNLTFSDGANIPHREAHLYVSAKGEIESPHKGYYIYVEQNTHTDPSTLEGMWLTNQTWYDCDGSCGLTAYNRFPDKGTANSQHIAKGAKFLIEQEDESVSDGSNHEAGAFHAEYGAIIENQTGNSIGDYASGPVTSAEQEDCGNGECWWLGNSYSDLESVLNEQFANDLTEGFSNAAVIY